MIVVRVFLNDHISEGVEMNKYTYPEGMTKQEKRKFRRAARAGKVDHSVSSDVISQVFPGASALDPNAEPIEEELDEVADDHPEDELCFAYTKAQWKDIISGMTDEDAADELAALLPSTFAKASSTRVFILELTEELALAIS